MRMMLFYGKEALTVLHAHFHGTVLLGHIRKASGEIKK